MHELLKVNNKAVRLGLFDHIDNYLPLCKGLINEVNKNSRHLWPINCLKNVVKPTNEVLFENLTFLFAFELKCLIVFREFNFMLHKFCDLTLQNNKWYVFELSLMAEVKFVLSKGFPVLNDKRVHIVGLRNLCQAKADEN
jgi:hypothetical protein